MNSNMEPALEKELVERAKVDSDAFGSLYDQYYSQIFSYILRRTADIQAAQDITSEVFFKALKNIGTFKWLGIPFSAWLYRIANNETATYFRDSQKRQVMDNDSLDFFRSLSPSPEQELLAAEAELQRNEQYLALYTNMIKLDTRYQEVITLRFFQNKQINEIAEILGKREGTVKSLLHRGLEKLRKYVE